MKGERMRMGEIRTYAMPARLQQLVQFLVGINGSLELFAMSMRFVIERTAEHTKIKSPFILQAYNFSAGITGILFEGCLRFNLWLKTIENMSATVHNFVNRIGIVLTGISHAPLSILLQLSTSHWQMEWSHLLHDDLRVVCADGLFVLPHAVGLAMVDEGAAVWDAEAWGACVTEIGEAGLDAGSLPLCMDRARGRGCVCPRQFVKGDEWIINRPRDLSLGDLLWNMAVPCNFN
ncbi:hypothetical protein BJ912DRAFT_932519 [Pholiota molesta]|nr:hypothetical protein BJ912DRAFT_932519 [Pholiota molesta]